MPRASALARKRATHCAKSPAAGAAVARSHERRCRGERQPERLAAARLCDASGTMGDPGCLHGGYSPGAEPQLRPHDRMTMHRRLDRFGSARVPSFSASASSLSYERAGVQSPALCEGVGNGSGPRKALRTRSGRDDRGDAQLHRQQRRKAVHRDRRARRPRPAQRRHGRSAAGGHPQRPATRAGFRTRARWLPLRPPRHQGCRLLRRGRSAPRLLPGDGSAGEGRERRRARRRVRSHAAHGRR